MMLFLIVVVFTAADTTSDTNATDYQQLVSTINQNEPNNLACFPFCVPMSKEDGKREYFWSAAQTMKDEQSARDINELHPKFRRWLTVEDRPSSSLAIPRLVARKQGLKKSMTSDKRGGRYQRPRPSLL